MNGLVFATAVLFNVTVNPSPVVNGGVFLLDVAGLDAKESVTLNWGGNDVPFEREGETLNTLLGVNIAVKPGQYPLVIKNGEKEETHMVTVVDAKYPVERLQLPPSKVSGFSKKTIKRIGAEKKTLDAIWDATSETRAWEGGWIWPVDGKITSSFGKRRIINGDPRSPHSGTDHRASTGTTIRAAHHGTVVLTEDQFFAGNLVIVDHGHGLYTMYFHLSKTVVKPGQTVKQGDTLGEVGATGRASGPHLHWGVRLLNHRVDPERLLALLPKK